MSTYAKKDDFVRARVSADLKKEAEGILSEMGLNMTDAIRLFLIQVVNKRGLPLDLRVPNTTTLAAMNASESSTAYSSSDAFFMELNSENELDH